MVKIEFLGPLGNKSLNSNATNFSELKAELQQIPELQNWLDSCAIALNDVLISTLDTPLSDGDKVSLLPPVCGG
ncbi:MAG: MoaD/ThiS family protein [Helicobacter sp.]|nr:MoaD/ThiS family protein [Helicobacter sp.]